MAATPTPTQFAEHALSPALRSFEENPFRVLRLGVNVTTGDASNQAANALTLADMGIPQDDPDPLPWLPPVGAYEIQQAAQAMEEPLIRLKYQMLWFDCVRDPAASLLLQALADPRSASAGEFLELGPELPAPSSLVIAADAAASSVCPACGAPVTTAQSVCGACELKLDPDDVIEESEQPQPPSSAIVSSDQNLPEPGELDLSQDLHINFWESIRGTGLNVTVHAGELCGTCNGSGETGETMECPSCKKSPKATCFRCDGTGRLPKACPLCRGNGRLAKQKVVSVTVPAGIRPGARLRLPGQGLSDAQGPSGSLYLTVKVQPHAYFHRDGDDIRVEIPVTAEEALQGATVAAPGLDGPVKLKLPEKTKSGQRFRLASKGVHNERENVTGNEIVVVTVHGSSDLVERLRRELPLSGQVSSGKGESRRDEARVEAPVRYAPADFAVVAHAINQANLRVFVAACVSSGILETNAGQTEVRKFGRSDWHSLNGFRTLPDVHTLLAVPKSQQDPASLVKLQWRGALSNWMRILDHPWFQSYAETSIAALADDYVSADDVETVQESVRTWLVDLAAQETRFLLLEGRYPVAGSMISAVAESGLETRIVSPALRPLRHVFQAEVSELDVLLDVPGEDGLEAVASYLKRLEAIKKRWVLLDESGIAGLRDLLDASVEKAYLQLHRLEKPGERVEKLLQRAAGIASAKSLREKFSSYVKEVAERRTRLCEFCKTEDPDYDNCVVITGKKETHREQHYNSTTIHYALRYRLLYRCNRCARFHQYPRKVATLIVVLILADLAAVVFLDGGVSSLFGLVVALVFTYWFFTFVHWAVSSLLALCLTPRGHRRLNSYRDTVPASELSSDGYSLEVNWALNAVAAIKKS